MADEQAGDAQTAIEITRQPYFPGMRQWLRRWWRGGREPPRYDGTHSPVEYRPCFRVVEWNGSPDHHTGGAPCGTPPHCSIPGGQGRHSEVRPDGLDWGEVHFSCLEEALANQAFRNWYENENGKAVVDKGVMTLHKPYYGADQKPPLPPYNFFLSEHVHEMSVQEVRAYQRTGEVPTRFRRRGRAKPGSPPPKES